MAHKLKELEVGEILKIKGGIPGDGGGYLLINTKSGVVMNLPQKVLDVVLEHNPNVAKNMCPTHEPCGDFAPCEDVACTNILT